ncbi:SdiA-regulated domain-containing protein [Methylovorus sp. MM2]|uniref:SdiA-regulated domain-containing protein n=1 Tax=Methylovorus sp. MM2 TaxID=1848038 RepID=UPI0009EEE497|nr:SdiA-regulated domain-containing protein [Methylovorus sp. MM2]
MPKGKVIVGIFIVGTIAAFIYGLRLESLGWHIWQFGSKEQASQFGLQKYRVEIEGLKIANVGDDLSGLTYNEERNTLFTVSNRHPQLFELSLDGKVLRKVDLQGAGDIEGITHVKGNLYIVVNERQRKLMLIDLPDHVETIDVSRVPQITLGIDPVGNKGFEGASWDGRNNRLLIVNERSPKRVLAIRGFIDATLNQDLQLHVEDVKQAHAAFKKLRDFSSLTYHDATGHLFLLSDESRMIVEIDTEGKIAGSLALWKGFHGLKRNIPQAEGMTIGPDKRIYVVSEPNLFYVFKPNNI